jgi:hypothetical protein
MKRNVTIQKAYVDGSSLCTAEMNNSKFHPGYIEAGLYESEYQVYSEN